jgi:hypothetical protein
MTYTQRMHMSISTTMSGFGPKRFVLWSTDLSRHGSCHFAKYRCVAGVDGETQA